MDAVGDLEDMWHVVADQDDRQAALLDVEHQLEHFSRFLDAERRSRLVHDDDAAAESRRPHYRNALALAARERLDRLPNALDGEQPKRVQMPAGLAPHLGPIEPAEALPEQSRLSLLAAEKEIVDDRECWRKR